MGLFKRVLTRRNLAVIVIGVLLAGIPLVVADLWIGAMIDRQGQAEVVAVAKRAVGLAEMRVDQVIGALDALAVDKGAACREDHVMAMRRAAFATMPIKEISVVASDGTTLCTDLDLPLGKRNELSREPLHGADGHWLDVLVLENGERMIRLRRKPGADGNSIAALVPTVVLLPQVANQGGKFNGGARISTSAGSVITAVGQSTPADAGRFTERVVSGKYGFIADSWMPRAPFFAEQTDLKWLGAYIAAAIILTLLGSRVLLPRRVENDPISDLKRALKAGEFVPYYQPIVDIRSGQLRGAEVLVRWRKPDGSLVFPGAFIPLAESSGLIRAMTCDLMRKVCVEAGAVLGQRPGLKISFNFAGKLFSDATIVKDVRSIFANTPIKLSQVVLEVTERDPIENFTETRQIIAALQGLGVRIAIDDVGTGHSGLSYMLKLGVDIIKIDKMFVDAIGTDRNSTTIVETLVDLAHNMRMDVVAEGVENFEQVTHLRELGIRSAQGYVFAPPLPGSAFLQLVEAIDPIQGAEAVEPKEAA